MSNSLLRAVIDTNVIFEGLTKQGSAPGVIIEAWLQGRFQAYVSNTVAYEYQAVLSRKLSQHRWSFLKPVLRILLDKASLVEIYYTWRPISPDPGDDHIIDCAMNGQAIVVTANIRDFKTAQDALGLVTLSPLEFISHLITWDERSY